MRGHPHLQPLRVSPGLRLYSDSGTRRPAARRGHGSAGFGRPRPRQPLRSAGPGWAELGSRAPLCICTMHARGSSYRRAPGWARTGRRGRTGGLARRGASALPSGADAELGEVPPIRPPRAGRPAGGPRGGPAADWSEVGSPLRLPAAGWRWEGMVCERLHALGKLRGFPAHLLSPGRRGEGFPAPRFYRNTNVEAEAT